MNNIWLRERREQLGLNQGDLAARLQVAGFNVDRSSISHWEIGKHKPPLENPEFRKALAQALRVSIPTLLKMAGYEIAVEYSDDARLAAEIVDQLSPARKKLAINLLEQLLKEALL